MTFRGSRILSIAVSTPLIAVVLSIGDHGMASEATPEQVAFFEAAVRTLLAEKCYRCHGPKKQRSRLFGKGMIGAFDGRMRLISRDHPP